jgi:hypothetical protein
MNSETIHIYTTKANRFREEQAKHSKRLSFTSVLRLVLFLVFAWFIYSAFKVRFAGYDFVYALFAIVGLLISVFWADSIKKKIQFLQQLILINENEIKIAQGHASFLDNGALFSPAKGFTVDLNVFGNHSLYHVLNRAGSLSGKNALGQRLATPFTSPADINNYQLCVQELSGKMEFRQTLLAHTLLFKSEENLLQLQAGVAVDQYPFFTNIFWRILAVLWPVAGVLSILLWIWNGNYAPSIAVTLLGLLLLSFIFKKVNQLYDHISKRSYLYAQYARCFELISNENFTHPYLKQKQDEIIYAAKAFKRLSSLTGLFDLRLSMLSLFINGLFLFDLLCSREYLNWNKKYQPHIKHWFDTLGEIELLNSLSTFHHNHPSFIFPTTNSEQLLIKANGMGHPLMKENTAVVNNVSLGDPAKLHLITGSNMSGKSTFLRTLGLNTILAQTGAPVFAKTFVFQPVRLLTSFHHIDSLEESTSYFYAELKCLQQIVQSLQQPVPALVLLDEVMRGTNSKDKHDGTALLIKKILNYASLSMIATHDTELGVLAEEYPAVIENYCFESELRDDELHFDFTMRKGVAQSKNATFLMQKMGIL